MLETKKNTANSHRCHQQEDQNGIWYLGLCCFISALLNFSYFQLVKVNVSATTFCCPFHYDYLLPTKMTSATFCCLFLVADQIGGQKNAARLFAVILVTVLCPKLKKRMAKGHAAFFVLQKDAKKTPKGRQANFVLHLVGNHFWTPKGRLCKKDGKKSWHLHLNVSDKTLEQQRLSFVSNVCHLEDFSCCRFFVILLVPK